MVGLLLIDRRGMPHRHENRESRGYSRQGPGNNDNIAPAAVTSGHAGTAILRHDTPTTLQERSTDRDVLRELRGRSAAPADRNEYQGSEYASITG